MIVGRKPHLSPAQQAQLAAWAAIGTSRTEAARSFGVGRSTITRYLRGALKAPIREAA